MRKKYILIFTLLLISKLSFTQGNLDSIFSSLNNKDLFIAPRIGGLSITISNEERKAINNQKSSHKRELFKVSSFNYNIKELAKKYSTKQVSEKLFSLLQDNNKDLYAAALLYELFDNRKLGKLVNISRDTWVSNGRKATDVENIHQFMKNVKED
ncbi:MAG TPA: hypothetical protein PKC72_09425 [Chitinophagaceae bacterium]|nr:hypothetical protein [Chitinophagaceae bacterium]